VSAKKGSDGADLSFFPLFTDTSTFFIGAPGVSDGNEALGKQISDAGLDFVAKCWRWEDMQA